MRGGAEEGVLEEVRRRAAGSEQPTTEAVAALLARAGSWSASDVHLVPDATVWSHFGQGYLFIPLVLPVAGLWWLLSDRGARAVSAGDADTGPATMGRVDEGTA